MCEWTEVFNHYSNLGKYRGVHINNIRHGQCMNCGTPLSVEWMWYSGASKSLCDPCYHKQFNTINYNCTECGEDIDHKVVAQKQCWREVSNHHCSKESCRALWALQHTMVTGPEKPNPIYHAPTQVQVTGPNAMDQVHYVYRQNQAYDSDVVEGEYTEVPTRMQIEHQESDLNDIDLEAALIEYEREHMGIKQIEHKPMIAISDSFLGNEECKTVLVRRRKRLW